MSKTKISYYLDLDFREMEYEEKKKKKEQKRSVKMVIFFNIKKITDTHTK